MKKNLEIVLDKIEEIIIFLDLNFSVTFMNQYALDKYNWEYNKIERRNFLELCDEHNHVSPIRKDYNFKKQNDSDTHSYIKDPLGKKIYIKWSIEQIDTNQILLKGKEYIESDNPINSLLKFIECIPGCLYWKDVTGHYLGCNQSTAKLAGLNSIHEIVGKTDEILWGEKAKPISENDQKVLQTGATIRVNETLKVANGELLSFIGVKMPLRDKNNKIIGIIGNSLDITAQKQFEKLELENAFQKTQLQAHDAFSRIVNQVVHDIRSPLASLLMIVKACSQIPERERLALRDAATSIGAIANNLLAKYNAKDTTAAASVGSVGGDSEAVLVSVAVLQLLTHKNFQYQSANVNFEHTFTSEGEFAFIHVDSSDFQRALSNLINNSVDALPESRSGTVPGTVKVKLDADPDCVKITLKDNGKGIPADVLEKIRQKIEVTSGKEDGHGIGLGQVQEMLAASGGKMAIDSTEGKGTEITLTFPRVHTITWIADSLVFSQDSLVIVLDDDSSIHHAWDLRFEALQPPLEVKHFNRGEDVLGYVEALSPADKQRVFLLSDFELLNQEEDGLDIIEQADVKSAVLVTSYYANEGVRSRAKQLNTKILPKQLASDVPMHVLGRILEAPEGSPDEAKRNPGYNQADLVLVDDDEAFANNLMTFMFMDKRVDYFKEPQEFRKRLESYPKNITIIVDNNFSTSYEKGINILKELHELGFTKLYLLSGEHLNPDDLPDYLVAIRKDKIDEIDF
jgi:signal transduction histidine kinase